MRALILPFLTFTAVLVLSFPARAQEPGEASEKTATRIEANEEASRIEFYVDGELRAVLDEQGMFVRGQTLSIDADEQEFEAAIEKIKGTEK